MLPEYSRSATLRQTLPLLLNKRLVDIGKEHLRLTLPLARRLLEDLTPGADDHTVTPAGAVLVVYANLASSDDIAQRLDSTSLKKRHPVKTAGIRVESRGVEEHSGTVALVVQSQLAEA
jgi:hypothetical protein